MKLFQKIKSFFKGLKKPKKQKPSVEAPVSTKLASLDKGVILPKSGETISTKDYETYVSKLNKAYETYAEYSSLIKMPKEFSDLKSAIDYDININRLDKMMKDEMMTNGGYLRDYLKNMFTEELGDIEPQELYDIEELVDELSINDIKDFLKNNATRIKAYSDKKYDADGALGDIQETTVSSLLDELQSYLT